MGRQKYFNVGEVKRNMICPICEKSFVGDIRNVNKQLEIHFKYKHSDTEYDTTNILVATDLATKKHITIMN